MFFFFDLAFSGNWIFNGAYKSISRIGQIRSPGVSQPKSHLLYKTDVIRFLLTKALELRRPNLINLVKVMFIFHLSGSRTSYLLLYRSHSQTKPIRFKT